MAVCIPKEFAQKFIQGLKDGNITPDKLMDMTSEERRTFLEDYVGKDDARAVNSLFESKLLLKDQKRGLVSWAKQVGGISEPVRRDMITRIENMTEVLDAKSQDAFFEDLASQKLGTDVTFDEAKQIADLSKQTTEAKSKINENDPIGSPSRLDYGAKRVALQDYVDELKVENKKLGVKDYINPSKLAGIAKGIKASLDDSAIFRQGWRTVFTNPAIWIKNALDSFANIAKQLSKPVSDNSVINGIKADVYSRPFAIDGTYQKMKLDVGFDEEAYPSTLPEKIPIFNRLYKASEVAYKGFLMRMRADIADKVLKIADESGVNIKDRTQLESIGRLINSLTGRGNLGSLEKIGKTVNTVFFSPKMLKSQIDFLTTPFGVDVAGNKVTSFARKQAALNLLKVISGTAVILGTAKALNPNSVEFDPRSSDSGKIKIGSTRFDMTGGMGSVVTLAARLVTMSSKSTNTGKVTPLNSGKFGSQTGQDVFFDFMTNKLSPAGSVIDDLLKGEDFNYNKPTLQGEAANLFVPLPITNAISVISAPDGANALLTIIADGLGISANTYTPAKKK